VNKLALPLGSGKRQRTALGRHLYPVSQVRHAVLQRVNRELALPIARALRPERRSSTTLDTLDISAAIDETWIVAIKLGSKQTLGERSASAGTYTAKVATIIAEGLADRVGDYEDPAGTLGSPEELAERMLSAVPAGDSPWVKIIGPAYTGSSLARALGVSRQRVSERASERTLWALKTADGHAVYPAAQFDTEFKVIPGLMDVLKSFDEADVDDWTLASWVMSAHRELEGASVIDWLRRHPEGSTEPFRLARRTAHRWSR
jgi:hypothetical protein